MNDSAPARKGDLIVIHRHHRGEQPGFAEILEVLGTEGQIRYRVHWDDGHESIFTPGADATIRRAGRELRSDKTGTVHAM